MLTLLVGFCERIGSRLSRPGERVEAVSAVCGWKPKACSLACVRVTVVRIDLNFKPVGFFFTLGILLSELCMIFFFLFLSPFLVSFSVKLTINTC